MSNAGRPSAATSSMRGFLSNRMRDLRAGLSRALIVAIAVPALSGLAADLICGAQAAGTIPLLQGPCQTLYPAGFNQYNTTPPVTYIYGAMNANGIPDGNNPWQTGNGTDNPPPGGRNGSALTYDLFMPQSCAAGGCPVIMMFHGGGGQLFEERAYQGIEIGSSNSGEAPRLSYPSQLTGNGYAVAVVWYPLITANNVNAFPAQVQAAVCALRHLKANAASLGINGDKVVTWGESAGTWFGTELAAIGSPNVGPIPDPKTGGLGTIGGVRQHWDNPGCFTPPDATNTQVLGSVNNYGFFDATYTQTTGSTVNSECYAYLNYFGVPLSPCPPQFSQMGMAEAGSPRYQASSATGFQIMLRGSLDTTSTDAYNQRWLVRTQALGIPSIYITIPNQPHGYFLLPHYTDSSFSPAVCTTLSYLQSVLNP